jgi:hypothetical protein
MLERLFRKQEKLPLKVRPYILKANSYPGTENIEFKKAVREFCKINSQLPELRICNPSLDIGEDERLVDKTIKIIRGLPLLIVSGDLRNDSVLSLESSLLETFHLLKLGYTGKWIYWSKQIDEQEKLKRELERRKYNPDSLVFLEKYFDDELPSVMLDCITKNYDARYIQFFSQDELESFKKDYTWLKTLEDFCKK